MSGPYAAGVPFQPIYAPLLNGETYDPQPAGGQVSTLHVYSDAGRTQQVASVGPAVRVSAGQYRFPAVTLATAGVYYATVIWTATTTGPTVTDTNDTIVVNAFGGSLDPTDRSPAANATWGPCQPWTTKDEIVAAFADLERLSDDQAAGFASTASEVLFKLSGCQYPGPCVAVVRPVSDQHQLTLGALGRGIADFADNDTRPIGLASLGPLVDPTRFTSRLFLGPLVITSIIEVLLDGTVLDPSEYRLDDYHYLIRLADPTSEQPRVWPLTQRLDLPPTVQGTLQVTLTYGAPPPPAGRQAATSLAAALAFQRYPKSTAAARPERGTSMTRQGVSLILKDPAEMIKQGYTGITDVDLWLRAENPRGASRSGRVWSPDVPRRATRPGTS